MNDEEYKKQIIEIVSMSQDIKYLMAIYTFAMHYPNQNKKEE